MAWFEIATLVLTFCNSAFNMLLLLSVIFYLSRNKLE